MASSPFVTGYPQQSFVVWPNPTEVPSSPIGQGLTSQQSMTAAAFAPRHADSPVKPQRGLRLVWCSERCHKNEMRELRTALLQSAQALGAQLQCLKKAVKFSAWLRSGQRQPYILVADWREIKPCMDSLQEDSDCNQPLDIVVLAESARVLERAELWAASRPDDNLILVEESGNVQEVIVNSQTQPREQRNQVPSSTDRTSQPDGPKPFIQGTGSSCMMASEESSASRSVCQGPNEDDETSSTCSGSITSTLGSGSGSQSATSTSLARLDFSILTPQHCPSGTQRPLSGAEEAHQRICDLLTSACGTTDPQAIEHMLLAAVPSHYEE